MSASSWNTFIIAGGLCGLMAGRAIGQLPAKLEGTVIAEWNFNRKTLQPSVGAGGIASVGSVGVSGITPGMNFTTGDLSVAGWNASSDPADAQQDFALQTGGSGAQYPAQGTASDQNGVEFRVSTVGWSGITVSFDVRASRTASRYLRFQYSVNGGTTWSTPPSPTGGVLDVGQDGNFINQQISLQGLASTDNNPDLRFRMLATFEPSGSNEYLPAGLGNSYDPFVCTIRYDMVQVRGSASTASRGPSGSGSSSRASICPGEIDPDTGLARALRFRVRTTPGVGPIAPIATVTGNFSSLIGGFGSQAFTQQSGDEWTTILASVSASQSPGVYSIPVTITDTLNRTTTVAIPLVVSDCTTSSKNAVKIREVYPFDPRLSPALQRGYVELRNTSPQAVFIGGWYLHVASATPFESLRTCLLGTSTAELTIPALGRYLIAVGAGQTGGVALPAPDAQSPLEVKPFVGSVALLTGFEVPPSGCPDQTKVDLVAYFGLCAEGTSADAPDSASALARKFCGTQDTNNNFADFESVSPNPQNSQTGFAGPAPTILFNPTAQTRCPLNPNAAFSVAATSGIGTPRFIWQVQDPAIPGGWRNIAAGAAVIVGGVNYGIAFDPTISTLNIIGAVSTTPGVTRVRCVVTDGCGAAFSNAADLRVCAADFNCANGAGVQDLFDFMAAWFAALPAADINGVNGVSVQDIFDFLATWFRGC